MNAKMLWRLAAWAWNRPFAGQAIRLLAGLLVASIFGYVFISRANLDELGSSLREVNVSIILLAVGVYFFNVWFQAVRWHFLIRHLGSPGSVKLMPPMLIGVMGNNILPLRMGMILRAEYLWSRFRISAPALLSTVVVEGWLDGVVLAVVFVPALAIIGTEEGIIRGIVISGGIAAGGMLLLRLAFTERSGSIWRRYSARLPRLPLPAAVVGLLQRLGAAFLTGLVSVRDNYTLFQALLWTAVAWLSRALELYIVGIAFGLDQPFTDYLVLTAALSATGIVQISPGNTGPYEFVVAEVLTGLGVARPEAAAYAIVSHLVLYVPVTIAGAIVFAWHRLTLPAHLAKLRPDSSADGVAPRVDALDP